MKKRIITGLGIALIAIGNAVEECGTTHGACDHTTPSGSTSACTTGVSKCADFTTANSCGGASASEWKDDFPNSCNAVGTSIDSAGKECYNAHSNCNSPNAECHRTVTCTWSGTSCGVASGSQGGWVELAKRTASTCT